MSEPLKKCPFCGGENVEFDTCKGLEDCPDFTECINPSYHAVVCNVNKGGCGASSGFYPTKEEAAEKWNRRVGGKEWAE